MKSAKQQLKIKSILNFLLLFLIFSFTLYALPVFAQGLVPCGGKDCGTCDLITLANNVVTFGWKFLILPLVTLGILASGLVLLTAGGSQTRLEMGRNMLWNIVIGFFIAASAWLIINTILGTLVQNKFYNPLTNPFPACAPVGTQFPGSIESSQELFGDDEP